MAITEYLNRIISECSTDAPSDVQCYLYVGRDIRDIRAYAKQDIDYHIPDRRPSSSFLLFGPYSIILDTEYANSSAIAKQDEHNRAVRNGLAVPPSTALGAFPPSWREERSAWPCSICWIVELQLDKAKLWALRGPPLPFSSSSVIDLRFPADLEDIVPRALNETTDCLQLQRKPNKTRIRRKTQRRQEHNRIAAGPKFASMQTVFANLREELLVALLTAEDADE